MSQWGIEPDELVERFTIGQVSRLFNSYVDRKQWEKGFSIPSEARGLERDKVLEYRKGRPVVSADAFMRMIGAI